MEVEIPTDGSSTNLHVHDDIQNTALNEQINLLRNQLEEERAHHQKQVEQLSTKMKEDKIHHENQLKTLSDQLEEAEEKNKWWKDLFKQVEEERMTESEVKEVYHQLDELQMRYQRLEEERDNDSMEYDKLVNRSRKEEKRLNSIISERDRTIEEYAKRVQALENELSILKKEMEKKKVMVNANANDDDDDDEKKSEESEMQKEEEVIEEDVHNHHVNDDQKDQKAQSGNDMMMIEEDEDVIEDVMEEEDEKDECDLEIIDISEEEIEEIEEQFLSSMTSSTKTTANGNGNDNDINDINDINNDDDHLFSQEESEPIPLPPSSSSTHQGQPLPVRVSEAVLQSAETHAHMKGPSGLPLFNLDRLISTPDPEKDLFPIVTIMTKEKRTPTIQTVPSDDESDTITADSDEGYAEARSPIVPIERAPSEHVVDTSILLSQLSQCADSEEYDSDDDDDSNSDDDDDDDDACREGEKEVKSAAVTSFLALMQKNKQITSAVQASAQQARAGIDQGSASLSTTRTTGHSKKSKNAALSVWTSPRSFLIDYVCNRKVMIEYSFQNGQQFSLKKVYKE